jgi:hypothetical protein
MSGYGVSSKLQELRDGFVFKSPERDLSAEPYENRMKPIENTVVNYFNSLARKTDAELAAIPKPTNYYGFEDCDKCCGSGWVRSKFKEYEWVKCDGAAHMKGRMPLVLKYCGLSEDELAITTPADKLIKEFHAELRDGKCVFCSKVPDVDAVLKQVTQTITFFKCPNCMMKYYGKPSSNRKFLQWVRLINGTDTELGINGLAVAIGGVGNGKTTVAKGIVRDNIHRGYSAMYIRYPTLIETIKESWGESRKRYDERDEKKLAYLSNVLERMKSSQLLVIDELEPSSNEWSATMQKNIIDPRYEYAKSGYRQTIVFTNHQLEEFDLKVADRFEESALDGRCVFNSAPSWRRFSSYA